MESESSVDARIVQLCTNLSNMQNKLPENLVDFIANQQVNP